jgi:hypothetical protein
MINYAGNPATYPASVRMIDNPDAPNGANFQAGLGDLADRTAYIEARFLPTTGGTITGTVDVAGGAILDVLAGGFIDIEAGAFLNVLGSLTIETGGTFELDGTGTVVGSLTAMFPGTITSAAVGGITSGVDGGIELSGSAADVIRFGTPHARSPAALLEVVGGQLNAGFGYIFSSGLGWMVTTGTANSQPLKLPLLHNGATLTAVNVIFSVNGPHSTLTGLSLPALSVFRHPIAAGSNMPTPDYLGTTTKQFFPTPGSAGAYDDSNKKQVLSYNCNASPQNVIDTTNYVYTVLLWDENGSPAVAGNFYYAIQCVYADIADMRFA